VNHLKSIIGFPRFYRFDISHYKFDPTDVMEFCLENLGDDYTGIDYWMGEKWATINYSRVNRFNFIENIPVEFLFEFKLRYL
jgi:hypothetical protein